MPATSKTSLMPGSPTGRSLTRPSTMRCLRARLPSLLEDERDFIANAANFAAFVYHALPLVNWAGFYFPDAGELVLGPFAGKPACTRLPKGRGVCGKAFESAKTVVIEDVNAFADHIVCDSASQSEIVVPLLHENAVYGVFDIDSPALARFRENDGAGIERLVQSFHRQYAAPGSLSNRAPRAAYQRTHRRADVPRPSFGASLSPGRYRQTADDAATDALAAAAFSHGIDRAFEAGGRLALSASGEKRKRNRARQSRAIPPRDGRRTRALHGPLEQMVRSGRRRREF